MSLYRRVAVGEKGEMRLTERVFRDRWPIDDQTREQLIERCRQLLSSNDPRVAVGAARALIAADSLNMQEVRLDLAGILARLQRLELGAQGSEGARRLPNA